MLAFISWYLVLLALGWLCFPLAHALFPRLPDRGYSLSRALGLLLWAYAFWLFGSLGIAHNDAGGILLALALPAITAGLALSRASAGEKRAWLEAPLEWLRTNRRYVISVEVLFLAAFAFLALVRAANLELTSAEKPMELAFISSTMRSEGFPPRDPWLSGYAISYYYFGYVMTAMLAKLTAVPATVAHNLMTALIFALGGAGSYGLLFNLLTLHNTRAATQKGKPAPNASRDAADEAPRRLAFLAPLFLLIVSNVEAVFELLYRRAILPASTWKWLDIRELTEPPVAPPGPLFARLSEWWTTQQEAGAANWLSSGFDMWFREQFMPERYLWWWRASRVVQDYDLLGNHLETIDEFPFFSFLHADLHPHVLAMPFALLTVAVALNIFLGGSRGSSDVLLGRVRLTPVGFLLTALVLGGLAFLNTWDILIGLALVLLAYVLGRAREDGWRTAHLVEAVVLAAALAVAAALLYLPFYLGFSSQAGGLLPNLITPTRGTHLWIMFATLFVPLLAWLGWLGRSRAHPANWRVAVLFGLGMLGVLWGLALLVVALAPVLEPFLAQNLMAAQGLSSITQLIGISNGMRLRRIGTLATLLALLIPATAFLTARKAGSPARSPQVGAAHAVLFAALLTFLGAVLVLTPEFIYLRDFFGTRINTVFKFYYQAWILWSLAAAFAVAVMLQALRGGWGTAYRVLITLVLVSGLIYPVLGVFYKTNNFSPFFGFTLDDFERVHRENPDEAAAIEWLRAAPDGVVAEVVGDSYSAFGRVSAYTGLQTVLGWPGHESQWRGGYEEQGMRREDIADLYTTSDWLYAASILEKYNIRYVFVGGLERATLAVNEDKFIRILEVAFSQGSVTIYQSR